MFHANKKTIYSLIFFSMFLTDANSATESYRAEIEKLSEEEFKELASSLAVENSIEKIDAYFAELNKRKININTLNVLSHSMPLLCWLALATNDTFAKALAIPNVDINIADSGNRTPLCYAASIEDKKNFQLLLDHKDIDLNKKIGSLSLLDLLILECRDPAIEPKKLQFNMESIALLLKDQRVDTNVCDEQIGTAFDSITQLHHCSQDKLQHITVQSTAIRDALIAHPLFDVNQVCNDKGETPLHIAIKRRDQTLVKTLMEKPNIKFDIKDKDGNTVPEMVRKYSLSDDSYKDICRYFRSTQEANLAHGNNEEQTNTGLTEHPNASLQTIALVTAGGVAFVGILYALYNIDKVRVTRNQLIKENEDVIKDNKTRTNSLKQEIPHKGNLWKRAYNITFSKKNNSKAVALKK